jgi:small subunit ribosomal protein S21
MSYKKSNRRRQWDDRRPRNRRNDRPNNIPKGRRPSHLTIVVREGEHPDRAIKRFLKKTKKLRIVEEYKNRQYYEKPSVKRRRDKLKRKETIRKANRKDE